MLDDAFIIDGVVHGWNFRPELCVDETTSKLVDQMYEACYVHSAPPGDERWSLRPDQFFDLIGPEILGSALFAESYNDMAIYHDVGMWYAFKEGVSAPWIGKKMQELWPHRVLRYGYLSPWQPNAVEEVDRLVEEGCVSLKLYPFEFVDGEFRDFRMDDSEIAYPVFQRAEELGLKSVAIHKAVPFGPYSIEPYKVGDISGAAAAFPNLVFEVVHGGIAFLEESALQVQHLPNVAINLEATSLFILNWPRKFATILGTFLAAGATDRIIWGTGCPAFHTRPLIEAFWQSFEIPQDLVDNEGFPQLTPEIKRGILGGNIARILELDIEDQRKNIAKVNDEFSQRSDLAEPWSGYLTKEKAAASQA